MPVHGIPLHPLNQDKNKYPTGAHPGAVSLTAIEPDLIKENIMAGKRIFGVDGIMVARLELSLPAYIDLNDVETLVIPDHTHSIPAPISSVHYDTYIDDPAHYIRRLDPAIALVDAEAIVVPDHSNNNNAPMTSSFSLKKVVDGAVKEDTPAQVDDTANAKSAAVNDMELLPAAPALNDAYYVGFAYPFDRVWLNIGTAGVGNWSLTEEYWDGGLGWTALAGVVDGTSQFMLAGLHSTNFSRPGGWALSVILGMNLYWMRYRVSNFVNMTTQPWGTQAWCEIDY